MREFVRLCLRPLTRSSVLRCALLGALASIPLCAQSFPARNFGPLDGLDNRSIARIAQDPAGFLWFATQNGVFRYDGAEFTRYSRAEGLTDPFVSNLWIGEEGTVWAATSSGLFYSDPRSGVGAVRRFEEVRDKSAAIDVRGNSRFTGFGANALLAVGRGGRPLLLTWDAGSSRWNAEAYSERQPALSPKEPVWGVFHNRSNVLWFGCGQAICWRDLASGATGALADVPPAGYETFFEEKSGRMWARSTTSVVSWLPGERTVHDLSPSLPAGAFNLYKLTVAQDAFGEILMTTSTGFLTWDGHRWNPTDTTTAGALAGATDLFSDHEGNLWIGTAGAGAFESLGYRQWQNFGTADGLNSPIVFSVATTRDRTAWIGTKLGLDQIPAGLNGSVPGHPVLPSALAGEAGSKWITNLLSTPDGGIWAMSDEGRMWHLNEKGDIDDRVAVQEGMHRLLADRQGTAWLAGRGVSTLRCRPSAPCAEVRSADPLLASERFDDMVFDDDGTLWLAGEHGLYRVPVVSGAIGAATHIDIPNSPGRFEQIARGADRTLWLAGKFPGIIRVRMDLSGAHTGTIVESHAAQELGSDYVEILTADTHGRLWIGSDQGITVLEGSHFTHITDQDGLVWNDMDWRAFLVDSDGSMWFGTSNGVSHLLDPEGVTARKPFQAVIEEGRYDGVPVVPGASVPWTGGILTLRFSGLTFRDSRSMVYHYCLEGFDANMVETHVAFARFQ